MKNINNKHIICIIPARGGSKGIPNKNLIPLCNKPLLQWSIEQAKSSSFLKDTIYVSSNDDTIITQSQKWGAHPIKRPELISGDTSSSESALQHALSLINSNSSPVDLIVFLQVDEYDYRHHHKELLVKRLPH